MIVFRGLPGCGKTQRARELGFPCVSRDDIRTMLYGKLYGEEGVDEKEVTLVQEAVVRALILAGRTVVIHDTCLKEEYLQRWGFIARFNFAAIEVIDMRDMPLPMVLARNEHRKGTRQYVSEDEILDMYDTHIAPLNLQ